VNIARDYLEPDRSGHHYAQELFELARRGEVEVATGPQGYRLDVHGDLAEQLEIVFRDEGVAQTRQLAYLSEVTFPGPDLFPGAFVEGFGDAWNRIAATWPRAPDARDGLHVETHLMEKRDVFVTDDRRLRVMCQRLREEHGFDVKAMSLQEYLDRRRGDA